MGSGFGLEGAVFEVGAEGFAEVVAGAEEEALHGGEGHAEDLAKLLIRQLLIAAEDDGKTLFFGEGGDGQRNRLRAAGDLPEVEREDGERRQLELAVALTLKPKAFVMDEPMAGLGASGSKAMTEFLDRLRREAPILLVEHDMDAVFALADRISVLVYGRIIATGTVDEIRADAGVREAYLGEDA